VRDPRSKGSKNRKKIPRRDNGGLDSGGFSEGLQKRRKSVFKIRGRKILEKKGRKDRED